MGQYPASLFWHNESDVPRYLHLNFVHHFRHVVSCTTEEDVTITSRPVLVPVANRDPLY